AGAIDYKLFVPDGLGATTAPLIVMLHGCTQSPDDFARGTRMNTFAREHGYVVAYPAQAKNRNASRCWNWFQSQDQQRGRGEPWLLAQLTHDVVKRYGLDDRRVFVAGMSAGGAMAAVLGSIYPDVYAAIGVHSGLPFGAAHDLPSAFAAMKHGSQEVPPMRPVASRRPPPAIVFHGDRDTTVDARNGAAVIAQCTADASSDNLRTTIERGVVPDGRNYTRTLFVDLSGKLMAEQWIVHGAGHAWSGGNSAGSYTDPSGPDASEHMLRFFSAVARGPAI
ncbi:MAG TPA: PHB depolymerase family esterase, partial [Casimicrobiaceae bacterium]|nr:PHB depolymerase family esterase [Casimicrobiaceae bacterium]